ncbi:MAG: hypothetical protein NZ902_04660 [Acidilobaceae archaeon]|nr:hypothetical protein [Acidilobaceae archaeon]MCX8164981.1 hypothetical protein [Acidilobaceae archaeon]MDW7974502.1 hypothetical protein [Sulfolobales archaeon]
MERRYKLVLRRTAKGSSVQLRTKDGERDEVTLLKLRGRGTEELFRHMVEVLKERGYVEAEKKGIVSQRVLLKPEVGPVVGGFLITSRRAKDLRRMVPLFDVVMSREARGSWTFMVGLLRLAEELSSHFRKEGLEPKVLDGLGAGAKEAVRKLWRVEF